MHHRRSTPKTTKKSHVLFFVLLVPFVDNQICHSADYRISKTSVCSNGV